MMSYAAYLKGLSAGKAVPGGDPFRLFQTLLFRKEMDGVDAGYKVPAYSWYPETEFCYMTNKKGFFVATKGGYNNESHNHNDAGTFSLYLNTTPIIIDAGVGTYTRQTFGPERYKIWTMQSNYHNLPMINGVPQQFGSQYKAETSVSIRNGCHSLLILPLLIRQRRVWKNGSVRTSWERISENRRFVLIDKADRPNQVNFLTWGEVDISVPGVVTIEVNGEKARMTYDKEVFTSTVKTIRLEDPRLSNVWGEQIYRVSLNAKKLPFPVLILIR